MERGLSCKHTCKEKEGCKPGQALEDNLLRVRLVLDVSLVDAKIYYLVEGLLLG